MPPVFLFLKSVDIGYSVETLSRQKNPLGIEGALDRR